MLASCGGTDRATTPPARVRASGAPPAATAPHGASARPIVLIAGTSLTAGLGLDPDHAYPALLQRMVDSAGFPDTIVNAGLSGETSAGLRRRIDWLLTGPADVVVIETGANDGLRGFDVDSTRANIQAIVRRVKALRPGAAVLLVQMEAPPNFGTAYTSAFHAMFPDVAREEGIALAPFLLEGVAGVARLNQSDGIHPNVAGERIVARNVWRALAPVLRARRPRASSDAPARAGGAPLLDELAGAG